MRQIILFVLLSMIFAGCTPRLYFPDAVNDPSFAQGHELKATINEKLQGGGTLLAPGADIDYAPINHLGIMASYRTVVNRNGYLYPIYDKPENWSYNNTLVSVNGSLLTFGAGYFTKFSKKGLFEVYGGYGNGSLDAGANDRTVNGKYFTTNYHQLFGQVAIGHSDSVGTATIGVRVNQNSYYNFNADPSMYYNSANPNGFVPMAGKNFLFIQPYANVEVGFKYLRFNFQCGLTGQRPSNDANGNSNDIAGDAFLYLSFGATFKLNKDLIHRKRDKAQAAREKK